MKMGYINGSKYILLMAVYFFPYISLSNIYLLQNVRLEVAKALAALELFAQACEKVEK